MSRVAGRGERSAGLEACPGVLPRRDEIASLVVCEDDEATLGLLCDHLVADRYRVFPAPTAADALRCCRYKHPDMLLLDLTLPDASGLDVLREIRAADGLAVRFDPLLPVIVLSGRSAEPDRVRGLETGADDYVLKPFSYSELRARIAAVLRRRGDRRRGPLRVGELVIDPLGRTVSVAGREIALTRKEFSLLLILASDPTRVFLKQQLLDDIWNFKDPGRTRTVDSHASRLRRKLDPVRGRYVVNCWGTGYRLLDE